MIEIAMKVKRDEGRASRFVNVRPVTVTVPNELAEELDAVCEERGVCRSHVVVDAVRGLLTGMRR